jgi:hypothetical protein
VWQHRNAVFTLFSVPKPFRGHIGTIQVNAVRSWTFLGSDIEVILFGAEEGVAEAAKQLGVRHEPEIGCDKYGTPLMSSIFERAQRVATHDWLCFVNSDIVLMSDLSRAMRRISGVRRPVLVSGRRWRLDVDQPLDFESGWEKRWRRHVKANAFRDSVGCMDYFIFERGLIRHFPKFAIGRGRWDSFLPYQARAQGALFVDATPAIMAVHQNHEYAIPAGEEGHRTKAGMKLSPAGIVNDGLVPREEKCTLGNADRKLTKWRLKRTYDHVRLRYWLWTRLEDVDHDTRLLGIDLGAWRKRHKVRLKRLLMK